MTVYECRTVTVNGVIVANERKFSSDDDCNYSEVSEPKFFYGNEIYVELTKLKVSIGSDKVRELAEHY